MSACAVDGGNALQVARRLPLAKRDVFFRLRALSLRAQIICAGRESRRGGDGYDWHGLRRGANRFVIFQYTLAGSGRLRWGRDEHAVGPGQAMLVPVPHDHRYWLPDGGSWDFIWVCLVGQEPQDAWRAVAERQGPVLDCAAHPAVLAAAVQAVAATLTEPDLGPHRGSALAYGLAMSLAAVAAEAPDRGHPGLVRAARWAQEHLAEDVSVDGLARLAGLSRHHFTRRFTRAYGLSPKSWLTGQRIQHACALLRDGEPVQAVATACGFCDASWFGKVFRQVVGMTPGEFRGQGLAPEPKTRR